MRNILLSVLLLTVTSVGTNAQSLDNSFGTNGTVPHIGLGNYFEATELPDGNVILCGDYETETESKACITKLKPNGSIDTSFGTNGKYIIDQYPSYDYYETFSKAIALPDGKLIVLYGSEYDNGIDPESVDIRIMRLNANGTVDNSFSGYSAQNISEDDYPYGLVRLPSGKLLMYGSNYMMRFNDNGMLDTSYANNGTRTVSLSIEELNLIGDAVYLYNFSDKMLVRLDNESSSNTKTYNLPENSSFYFFGNNIYIRDISSYSVIKKLDSNFNLVNNFANGGTATFDEYIGYNFIFQPQGSIIAKEYSYVYDNDWNHISTDVKYRRVNPDGSLDLTFGTGGVYKINIPATAPYYDYSDDYIHSNGKLYHLFYDNNWVANNIYIKRSNLSNEVLAVSDNTLPKDVRIMQNPVYETLKLSSQLFKAKIYDMSGKDTGILFEGKQASVQNLKPGVYLINAVSESGSKISLKFIKK